jgi:NTE family protein
MEPLNGPGRPDIDLMRGVGPGGRPGHRFHSPRFDREQIGLCLSGGGYKACLFHVGALSVLNERGILPRIGRIASVSGGSIAAARLAIQWKALAFDPVTGVSPHFQQLVAGPLLDFCRTAWLALPNIVLQLFRKVPSAVQRVADAYHERILGGAMLAHMPQRGQGPEFIILSTNFETRSPVRFYQHVVADWQVGQWRNPHLRLADAVAASSAFPPVLSPFTIKTGGLEDFPPDPRDPERGPAPLHREPFTKRFLLVDGGLYDNMGLEPVWKRCGRIIVSNAGDPLDHDVPSAANLIPQLRRVISMIHRQAETNRVRTLFDLDARGERDVAYCDLRSDPAAAGRLQRGEALTPDQLSRAQSIPVDLKPLGAEDADLLIRLGRASTLSALRYHPPGLFDPKPLSPGIT